MNILTLCVGDLDTNCHIVYDDAGRHAFVCDPGDEAGRILDAVNAMGLSVVAVVLTHAHFDHFLAAGAVCRATGAPLWLGREEAPTAADPQRNLSGYFASASPLSLMADRLLAEGDVLTLGEETLTVLETPGHTPGGICLLGEELLLSGDTLFAGSIGRLDFPGGSPAAMQRSLARLAALPSHLRVYPGHGEPTTIARERAGNPYLKPN